MSSTTHLAGLFLLLAAATTTTTTTPLHPHSSSYVFAAAATTASSIPTDYHHPHVVVKTKSKNLLDAIGNKFELAAIATHNAIIQQAKEEEEESDASSSDDVVGATDLLLGVSGVLPTNEPATFWNTYDPTTPQGNDVMEAEEMIASPTPLPSSFPTLLVKKSVAPTLLSIKHTTDDTDYPTLISTLPTEKEDLTSSPSHVTTTATTSLAPSQAPSRHITESRRPTVLDETTLTNKTVTSVPSLVPDDDQDCPELFDKSAFYIEDDVISTQGPLFCRSEGCRIIYKCTVPAFCNIVVPGKEHSEEGWFKIGYCGNNVTSSSLSDGHVVSIEEEEAEELDVAELPSSFPTPLHDVDDVTEHQGTEVVLGEEEEEAVPTSRPTSWQFGINPTLPTPPENDDQSTTAPNSSISVSIPKIICDISLSSSLTENFEQTHVLLVVMTKTIYDIFEPHLSKELYDLTGISLNVSTEKNQEGDSSSSIIRLHAFFTGTASFSLVAPTQSDLTELLLLHFDVQKFTNRLTFPLRLRTMEEPVVMVNSVFFTLEDGSLVNAGYKNAKEFALSAVASSHDGKEGGLSVHQIQIITVFFVVAALPFVFVAIVLIMLRYMDEDDLAYLDADDMSTDESATAKPEVEEGKEKEVSVELDEAVTAAINIKPSVKLELDIPLTGIPLSDISESQSEWSSISDSLHDYTRDIESPAKVGLGITAAGHHYRKKGTPYVGQAAAIGLVPELWEHHDHLEVYEDYIIDV